ncbi:MAG TPA: HAD family hydrolase [Gemmatimonadaceae bacterium]|jgi:beta-phosphoglucomutase-like phosphatase (HAD superfamily)
MVDAVLLELEGVVFDTRELRRLSLRDALVEQGLAPSIDHDAIDGSTPRAAVERSLAVQALAHDDVLLGILVDRVERAFSGHLAASGAALCEGAQTFVQNAAASARLAIVTSARRSDVDTMLRLASLADYVSVIVAAEDALEQKPSTEGHRLALGRLSKRRPVTMKGTLALEHGLSGIRAARESGITCVAIGPLAAHIAMEADAYVPTLATHTIRSLDHFVRTGEEQVQ